MGTTFRYWPLFFCLATAHVGAADWMLNFTDWPNSTLSQALDGKGDVKRRETLIRARWGDPAAQTGLRYAHQPILVRSGDPANNGYFHQLDALHDRQIGRLELNLVAGLHATSNMFKHGDYHQEALVGSGAAMLDLDARWLERAGIAGDYRFGRFLIYPRLEHTFRWRSAQLQMQLPNAVRLHHPSDTWSVALYRYGEKWATLDKDRSLESAFYIGEWRLEGGVQVPLARRRVTASFGAGISFDTRLRYRDLTQGAVTERLDPAPYATVGLRW